MAFVSFFPGSSDPVFRRTALLCWFGWVFDFFDLILIAFLIPTIEQSFRAGPETGAWLVGVGLGASGLGGIIFGRLADRYGRKPILTVTVLLFSIGMLLTGASQTITQFLIARFITGIGLGGEWAVGHALIAESVPANERARWSAFLQSGEPVGVAIAAVVGFSIAPLVGWRTVIMGSALTGFLALAFRKWLQESPQWLDTSLYKTNQTYQETETRVLTFPGFLSKYGLVTFLAFVLAVFKLGTYWTCYTWLPRFISESFGAKLNQSALWILSGQVGQYLGMRVFGNVADRYGRRWAFSLFSVMTALALGGLACFWSVLFNTMPVLFWTLITIMGFGSGCTAGFGALLSELFPIGIRTFAMGSVYNAARGVQLFSPVLVAQAVQVDGLRGGLLIPAGLAILTALWVWTLPDKKGQTLD